MSTARKTGIILLLIGFCLPTATMPFITEFHPQPDICLTSNFFGNLGNMVVTFHPGSSAVPLGGSIPAIPYRYLFSFGIILSCVGLGIIVLSTGNRRKPGPISQEASPLSAFSSIQTLSRRAKGLCFKKFFPKAET